MVGELPTESLWPRSGEMLCWAEQKLKLQPPVLFIKKVVRSGEAHQAYSQTGKEWISLKYVLLASSGVSDV